MDPDFDKLQKMLTDFDAFYKVTPNMPDFTGDKTRKCVSDFFDKLQDAYDILDLRVYRINPDRCAKCKRVHKGECAIEHPEVTK